MKAIAVKLKTEFSYSSRHTTCDSCDRIVVPSVERGEYYFYALLESDEYNIAGIYCGDCIKKFKTEIIDLSAIPIEVIEDIYDVINDDLLFPDDEFDDDF